jgi:hypothetical protein
VVDTGKLKVVVVSEGNCVAEVTVVTADVGVHPFPAAVAKVAGEMFARVWVSALTPSEIGVVVVTVVVGVPAATLNEHA